MVGALTNNSIALGVTLVTAPTEADTTLSSLSNNANAIHNATQIQVVDTVVPPTSNEAKLNAVVIVDVNDENQ